MGFALLALCSARPMEHACKEGAADVWSSHDHTSISKQKKQPRMVGRSYVDPCTFKTAGQSIYAGCSSAYHFVQCISDACKCDLASSAQAQSFICAVALVNQRDCDGKSETMQGHRFLE